MSEAFVVIFGIALVIGVIALPVFVNPVAYYTDLLKLTEDMPFPLDWVATVVLQFSTLMLVVAVICALLILAFGGGPKHGDIDNWP